MLLRLRLLTGTMVSSLLLLVMLCLGSQNLNQRETLQLGFGQSAPPVSYTHLTLPTILLV